MVSQHRPTSHFSYIIDPFRVTPLAVHTRHLRVGDGIGQCFLSLSSNLRTLVTAAGGLPIGICTFYSCQECANKFHSRLFRKFLCEIFLPPNEEKRMWVFKIVRSNRRKNSIFVHFHVLRLIEHDFTILSPLST